jgi:pimeloyl-ACP methyl ester carboxylesterase
MTQTNTQLNAQPWTLKKANLNGQSFNYAEAGLGKTILFLHGFPEFWYTWKDQLTELSRNYKTVAMDMRGYNLSSKPPHVEDYAIPHLVADVKAMLDFLSPDDKPVLVAHDWGGIVAWHFAITYPDYLDKLVIINSPHPAIFSRELASNPEQQQASSYILFFRTKEADAALAANNYALLANVVFNGCAKPESFSAEDKQAYIDNWSQPGAITAALAYYRAADLSPAAGKEEASAYLVKAPTLVIWGEQDKALRLGNLNGLDQYVPNLTIKRIPTATHWVMHDEPALVHNYIREFLG